MREYGSLTFFPCKNKAFLPPPSYSVHGFTDWSILSTPNCRLLLFCASPLLNLIFMSPLPLWMAMSSHHCTEISIHSLAHSYLYLNYPTFSPGGSSCHLPSFSSWPACLLEGGEWGGDDFALRKWTIAISQSPNIWDMLSSPHPSITHVILPLGPLRSSSDLLFHLLSSCNTGGLPHPQQGPMSHSFAALALPHHRSSHSHSTAAMPPPKLSPTSLSLSSPYPAPIPVERV